MASNHDFKLLEEKSSELLNELATKIDSVFQEFVRKQLKDSYKLNLLDGHLETFKKLHAEKVTELNELGNCSREKWESLNTVKQKLETELNEYEVNRDQTLQDKFDKEQEIQNLVEKVKVIEKDVKNLHKTLKFSLKLCRNSLGCYMDIDESDPDVFTLYFFTQKKSSDNNWFIKMKLKDGNMEFIQAIPELPRKDEMASHLSATGDIQGFLYCVYENFRFLQSVNHTEEFPIQDSTK